MGPDSSLYQVLRGPLCITIAARLVSFDPLLLPLARVSVMKSPRRNGSACMVMAALRHRSCRPAPRRKQARKIKIGPHPINEVRQSPVMDKLALLFGWERKQAVRPKESPLIHQAATNGPRGFRPLTHSPRNPRFGNSAFR